MNINKLELTNFGPFYGKHRIDFKPGINIIFGKNGSGKTCIFKAIRFGLFGNTNSEINKKIINRHYLETGGKAAGVRISFTLLGNEYNIERALLENGDSTTVMNITGQKNQTMPNVEDLYQKLPPYTSSFFLFDGEEIRHWMMSLTNDKWVTASLLGFNIFRSLISDLELAKAKINESLTDIEQRTGITHIRNKIVDLKNEIQLNNNSILQIRTKIKDIDRQLQNLKEIESGLENYKTNMEKLKVLGKDINKFNKKINHLRKKARSNAQLGVYSIIKEDFIDAIEIVEHMKELAFNARLEQGRLDAQLEILQEIESKERCICGNELAASTYGKKSISNLVIEMEDDVKKFDKAANAEFWPNRSLMDMRSQVELATLAAVELKNDLKGISHLQTQLDKLNNDKELSKTKIQEIQNNVQPLIRRGNIQSDIWSSNFKLTNEILKLERKKNVLIGRMDIYYNLVKNKNKELKNNENNLVELQNQRRAQLDKFSNAIHTFENLSGIIDSAVNDAITKMIKDLKNKFKEIFKTITNKPNEYIDVDFSTSEGMPLIITQNGSALAMADISDGEKQILIFALMAALKHLSPTEALVVDAPFGRLDSVHTKSIIKFLPKMAPQTIMMITDREFKEITKSNINTNIWNINNESEVTKLELLK